MNVVRGLRALRSVPLFIVREILTSDIRDVLLDRVLGQRSQVGIPPQEARREVLGYTKHVMQYEDLAVAVRSRSDSNSGYRQGLADLLGQL